jgi:hypothetical protein
MDVSASDVLVADHHYTKSEMKVPDSSMEKKSW